MDNSKYTFEVSSEMPNWSDDQGTPIVYASGTTRRLCVYIGDQWNYFGFMDSDGKIIVDGEIEIGTTLKADGTNGLWLGHTTFASAPFRVSLAGALVATSATITGAITAESGTIGGFTIGASALTAGGGASAVGMAPASYPFYAGGTTASSAPFRVSNTGLVELGDSGSTYLLLDGPNVKIESSDYSSGIAGAGFHLSASLLETSNIACRGIIRTAVFQKDTISAVGGNIFVTKSADVLATDMTALDASTLTIEGNVTFEVNDVLRIKDGTEDEWLLVTNIGSAPTYTVTRDQNSDYSADDNPVWTKGATVVNYGASGAGGIFITASETNAPYIKIFTHAGAPWTTITTYARIGQLNGDYGFSSSTYGIGLGDYANNVYLTYDTASNVLVCSEMQSSDYVADTTGYKLSATSGLEINTGTIQGTDLIAKIMVYAMMFGS